MTEETHIDYDAKVQDALRGVVRTVLTETAAEGMKGDHHFYIAFKTQADGVDIPLHLIERFPEEMTIVLQHKFWGLKVEEDYFEVGLSFNQRPETLVIPFEAVVGFVDPSVQFALQFHSDEDTGMQDNEDLADFDADLPPVGEIAPELKPDAETPAEEVTSENSGENTDNVVTLDAFRKK